MHLANDPRSVAHGVLGVCWLAGLWLAASYDPARHTLSAKLAFVLVLGTFLPLALGLLDVLYWWSLWLALAVVVAFRIRAASNASHLAAQPARGFGWDLALGWIVLVALAWPVAVRPVMADDTLIYHLPNAASWIRAHGVWITDTRYWWYPPASEMFASGLLCVSGLGAVGFASLLPAALLVAVARDAAERAGRPPFVGVLAACALLATPVVTKQLVGLQNDLWLSALAVYVVVNGGAAVAGAVALTKPYGIAFALLAAPGSDRSASCVRATVVTAVVAFAAWLLRDAILAPHALVPIASTMLPNAVGSTIAAHLPGSSFVFARAMWHAGIAWTICILAGMACVAVPRTRALVGSLPSARCCSFCSPPDMPAATCRSLLRVRRCVSSCRSRSPACCCYRRSDAPEVGSWRSVRRLRSSPARTRSGRSTGMIRRPTTRRSSSPRQPSQRSPSC